MCGIPRRCANAWKRHDVDFGLAETRSAHYRPNLVLLVERERDVVKVRRILGKELLDDRLGGLRSEEHTSELQSRLHLVCRLLLEKKKKKRERRMRKKKRTKGSGRGGVKRVKDIE